jgi:hypothetical protein
MEGLSAGVRLPISAARVITYVRHSILAGRKQCPQRPGDDISPASRGGDSMSINKTRRFLYQMARLLGDVNAVKQGKVGKRIVRRAAGRATGRAMRKLFK